MTINNLTVCDRDGILVVDSRLIAEGLDIEHRSFLRTLETYRAEVEQAFGGMRFEIAVPEKATGNPPRYALLTEDQAIFVVTLSRNSPEVVQCKIGIVKAFSEARKACEPETLTGVDLIVSMALQLKAQETRQLAIEKTQAHLQTQVERIDAEHYRVENPSGSYYAVLAYAVLHNIDIDVKQAAKIGKAASAFCKANGVEISRISDPRFGMINAYPMEVLAQVFSELG